MFRIPVALFACSLLVLSACSSNRELLDQQTEMDRLQEENTTLRSDLESAYELLERTRQMYQESQARVDELERMLSLRGDNAGERGETVAMLPTDIFFESGSAELTPDGVAGLVEIAQRLRSDYAGRSIRIEGYTDSNPIGPNLAEIYPSNWELSAARAAMVARHLQWTHSFEGNRMEVVGLSQYYPTGDNATAEGREQNRRVRIAVMAN